MDDRDISFELSNNSGIHQNVESTFGDKVADDANIPLCENCAITSNVENMVSVGSYYTFLRLVMNDLTYSTSDNGPFIVELTKVTVRDVIPKSLNDMSVGRLLMAKSNDIHGIISVRKSGFNKVRVFLIIT